MPRTPRTRIPLLTALLGLLLAAGGCFVFDLSPSAVFTMSADNGESPLVVTFDASASTDPDGAVVLYEWDFGDGATGTGRIAIHVYTVEEEAVFTVRLTVADDDGNRTGATKSVTVRPAAAPEETATIEFVWPFHYDAYGDDLANLNDEYFTLQNTGAQTVDLSGWTVSNERGQIFHFPDGYALGAGDVVFVHSGTGSATENVLYWGATAPVWNNDGDVAVLYDSTGLIVTLYAYEDC